MNKESYVVKKGQIISSYEFFSEGPRGKIRKVIAYQEIPGDELIFNLAFGDINEMGEIDDLAISNNSDARKILITVAKTAIDFLQGKDDVKILATGSTPARTRLYQMGITQFWEEISTLLEVKGYYVDQWRPFEKGINYEAFLVARKQISNFTL
ncbi:MAG TPA: hypothetical protein VK541_22950 [Pedobacter sp.]|jgi:hypothetical protein|uniref:DUF6934 family protein n=1 Tax=Pedobacter sp. TaxID=1411316 RepID=UPI002CB5C6D1|nr:hypothetical protein [Pedobacter sp.]HMI05366.1 hypothetical protein [Pedobacter sp.]